ncbi:MAG: 2-hydroxyacyl-CoA dehydratase [Chloroflexi bacterium]|nr:2-hydroxyacyl-CoA dehydratase [Chloroflexota bacterium]
MPRSKISGITDKFRAVVDEPYEKLKQWKEVNKKKIVGCSPMHFPEELIHAAGMLPVVLQETDETITTGFSYIYPFFCGITRNLIDIGVKGQLGFLDGLIYSDLCVQNRTAASILRQNLPSIYVEFAQLPSSFTKEGVMEDTIKELDRIKANLEKLTGRKIDDKSLKQSILVYNKNRSLLRRLHDLHRADPKLLPYRDMQVIVQSSMLMPKEEHTQLLEELLSEMEGMKPTSVKGSRLFLSGHLCQSPKADILDLIEGVGGVIVDDDLYTGYRHYAVDVEVNGSPIQALAKRHLEKSLPVPTRTDLPIRWEKYLVDRVKASKAQGAVILVVKFCEPHLFYYPFIKEALAKACIPHIMVETEHEVVSLEGVRTRLQAFIEMLR